MKDLNTSTTTGTAPTVSVDHGEVLIVSASAAVVVEFDGLTSLIEDLTAARDQLQDAQ